MAVQFHTLTVTEVTQQTPQAISITFAVPEHLRPVFQYRQGQYITIKMDIDGVSHRRNYSLCSSPYDDEPLTIAVKRVSDGVVSTFLNTQVRPGASIEVYPPMGNFTRELDPTHARTYVLFGGGSGITPLLSILKSILRVESNSTVTLVYANRDEASIMFDDALQALQQRYGSRLQIVHVLEVKGGREAMLGRIDATIVDNVFASYVPDPAAAEYFVCGPGPMMQQVIDLLHARGIDDHHLHREYFTLATNDAPPKEQAMEEQTELKARTVKIKLYGSEHTFVVEPDETILSAAVRENLDPPFACQIGACCTCRAKIVTGKVMMDEREALSDDEIEDGFALTCQSHPLTDDVFADYDQ